MSIGEKLETRARNILGKPYGFSTQVIHEAGGTKVIDRLRKPRDSEVPN